MIETPSIEDLTATSVELTDIARAPFEAFVVLTFVNFKFLIVEFTTVPKTEEFPSSAKLISKPLPLITLFLILTKNMF